MHVKPGIYAVFIVAVETFQLGMVKVVPLEKLEEETMQWCSEIPENHRQHCVSLKRHLMLIQMDSLDFSKLYHTTDEARVGRGTFMEKKEA